MKIRHIILGFSALAIVLICYFTVLYKLSVAQTNSWKDTVQSNKPSVYIPRVQLSDTAVKTQPDSVPDGWKDIPISQDGATSQERQIPKVQRTSPPPGWEDPL